MGEAVLKSPRFRPLRAVLSLSLLLLVALIAGCGGDDGGGGGGSSEDAQAVIDKAFSTKIESANVTLDLEAKVDGVAQLQDPIKVSLKGPFQSNGETKLPSLDWDAEAAGGGQSVAGGIISTGDALFVNFQNQNYEVPKEQVDQINQQLASQKDQTAADLGVDPKNWVTNASDEGEEDVNGEATTHVTADVDVGKMLTDLNKAAQSAGGAMGGAQAQQLTPQQIDQVKQFVKDPKFDVYASKEDGGLRRLNVSLNFEIPEAQRAQAQGATGGSLTFTLDFADVGQEQTIEAPTDAKPLSELQGALGGLGGAGATPPAAGGGTPGGSSGGSGPDAKKLEDYSKCLQQADPSDSAALQKCQAILE
jgi:hypothetical protein